MSTHTRSDSRVSQVRLSIPANGSRVPLLRSLGTTDRVKAAAVASSLQSLADAVPSGEWLRIKRTIEDCFLAAGHPVPLISRDPLPVLRPVSDFVKEYLGRRKDKVKPSHYALMKRCLVSFAATVKGLELAHVKGLHVQSWLDGVTAEGLSAGTVRNMLVCVSGMWRFAVTMGYLSVNPCAGVEVPDMAPVVLKQPMADVDFEKLGVYLRENSPEWALMAALGMYAGVRIGDAARMLCSSVVVESGNVFLRFCPGKTGAPLMVPVLPPLAELLKPFVGGIGFVMPSLAPLSASLLSKQFSELLVLAQVNPMRTTLLNGRCANLITFHSLRHSNRVLWARLGVPSHLSMKMMGHASRSVHDGYNHEDAKDLLTQMMPYFPVASRSD